MAKKRARGAGRELTRAEVKALERRAAVSAPVTRHAPVLDGAVDQLPPMVTTTTPARRGVLPPRARVVTTGPALTPEQELNYIRGDLRRMIYLAAAMIALIIVLAFVLPLVML